MAEVYQGWPGKLVTGPGSLAELGAEVNALGGGRTIVFTDKGLAALPWVGRAVEQLRQAGIETAFFCNVEPNPTDGMVMEAVELMKRFEPKIIVCIGGGSPMDCAKVANVIYTHGGEPEDYNVNFGGIDRIEDKLLPLIAVPTTAGTGSEVTDVGVVTGMKRRVKFGVKSPYLIPDTVILDPLTTVGLGKGITASTGVDAMTHCIESYVSTVDCCISNAEALEGIRLIKKYLPIVYENGEDLKAREMMMNAAMMAGASFNINNLGLCHQMAHQLSAYFGMAHGVANAMLLPHVMRFNLKACPQKFADIAQALGCDTSGLSPEAAGIKGIEEVERFCRQLGIPEYLNRVGVDRAQVPAMAVTALLDTVGWPNPVATTVAECEALFYECFE